MIFAAMGASLACAQSLIAYYPFNGDAKDNVGSKNGTVYGATLTTDQNGNANSAYSFDGLSSYIEVPGFPDLTGTSFTISMLVYPRSSGQSSYDAGTGGTFICRNTSATYAGYSMGMSNYGTDNNKVKWWNKGYNDVYSGTALQMNTWYCVTLVFKYNGNNNNEVTYYINGNYDNSKSGIADIVTPTSELAFGKKSFITGYFDGKIDEVKVWNYALTSNEVKSNASCAGSNGISEVQNSYNYNAYPNPIVSGENFNIVTPTWSVNSIRLYNAVGEQITTPSFIRKNNGSIQMSTVDLPNGVYFIELVGADTKSTVKLIVL